MRMHLLQTVAFVNILIKGLREPCGVLLLAERFDPGIYRGSRREKACSHAGGRVASGTGCGDDPADAVLQVT